MPFIGHWNSRFPSQMHPNNKVMPAATTINSEKPSGQVFQWIGTHWFETFLIVYGLWIFAPFLAPFFMQIGWFDAGKAVYFIYSFFCHQLPERSFFFFGEKSM